MLVLIHFVIILLLPPTNATKKTGLFAHLDKNKLLKETKGVRLILVGGSNLSFGINSKCIIDSFNVNTINTGLYYGFGLKFMMSNTLQFIHPKDIVIIAAEYENYFDNFADGDISLLSLTNYVDPELVSLLDKQQIFKISKLLPQYCSSKVEDYLGISNKLDSTEGIYDRNSFNEYGDATTHWDMVPKYVKPIPLIGGGLNKDVFKSLRKFMNNVQQKGAKVYITFPCMQDSSFFNNASKIHQVESELIKEGFLLLSKPERYIFKNSMIFNTCYHLTKEGVDKRTNLLIDDLKEVIKDIKR